jgi:hypothetical protein
MQRSVLARSVLEKLRREAEALGTSPAMLVAAAWSTAIAEQAAAQGAPRRPISLEVPVSFRKNGLLPIGNHVSPLLLFAEGGAKVSVIAQKLGEQLRRGLRSRGHLAMPILTRPAAWLPYRWFRRSAANTAFSGFASSHFTWLDGFADALQIPGASMLRAYTPVCLRMGAALLAVPMHDGLLLSVTHRRAGISEPRARTLLARTTAALEEACVPTG